MYEEGLLFFLRSPFYKLRISHAKLVFHYLSVLERAPKYCPDCATILLLGTRERSVVGILMDLTAFTLEIIFCGHFNLRPRL